MGTAWARAVVEPEGLLITFLSSFDWKLGRSGAFFVKSAWFRSSVGPHVSLYSTASSSGRTPLPNECK